MGQRLGVVVGFVGLLAVCGLAAVVAQPSRCVADDASSVGPTAPAQAEDFARNIIKLRLTSIFLASGVGLGYEYAFTKWLTVGASIGTGFASGIFDVDTYATGGDVAVYFMTEGDHKFAGGVGLAVNYIHERSGYYQESWFYGDPVYVEAKPGEWGLGPALSAAYRYQPAASGFFFEGGVGFHAGLNGGLTTNFGYVF